MVKSEKSLVFDQATGNPKEIRYYEDDKLVARWEIILDKDANFIGIRNLDVEEVAPSSWLDWFKRRKAKPIPVTIQTVDFIGLINWINTIKTIKTIENIDLIKLVDKITLIDEISKIGEITTIRDLTWSPQSLIQNWSFEQGFAGWTPDADAVIDTIYHTGKYGCKLLQAGTGDEVKQQLVMPVKVDWLTEFFFYAKGTLNEPFNFTAYYTDGTNTQLNFNVTHAIAWQKYTITGLTAGKYIERISLWNVSVVPNTNLWVDDITIVF